MEKAIAKALENGPKIGELATAAKDAIAKDDAVTALHDEEEALRLLKEILDELPKKQQQQQQQQQQDQKDQQNQDQQSQDEPQQQQPKQDKDGDKDQPAPKPQQLTKDQAEQLLRKAVERAKQKAEQTKDAREAALVPGKVDRDW
jgi:hypothetical protein